MKLVHLFKNGFSFSSARQIDKLNKCAVVKMIEIKLAEEEKNQCLQRHLAMRSSPLGDRNLPVIRFFASDIFFCGLKVDKLLHCTSATGPKYRHRPGTGISALAINLSQLSESGSIGRRFDSQSPGFSLFAIAARSFHATQI